MGKSHRATRVVSDALRAYMTMLKSFFDDGAFQKTMPTTTVNGAFTAMSVDSDVAEIGRELTTLYTNNMHRTLRRALINGEAENVFETSIQMLFAHFMGSGAAAFRTHQGKAMEHHWVPRCYIKRFAQDSGENGYLFDAIMASGKHKIIDERMFIHPRSTDGQSGFFPDAVETFFSKVETHFAEGVRIIEHDDEADVARKSDFLWFAFAAFYSIQRVRAPKEGSFSQKRIAQAWADVAGTNNYVDAVFEAMDEMRHYASFSIVEMDSSQIFAPMVPTLEIKHTRAATIKMFPVTPTRMVVFSKTVMTPEEAKAIASTYNATVANQARKLGTFTVL